MPNRYRFQAYPTINQTIAVTAATTVVFQQTLYNTANPSNVSTYAISVPIANTFNANAAGYYTFGGAIVVTPGAAVTSITLSFASSNTNYNGQKVFEGPVVAGTQILIPIAPAAMLLGAADSVSLQYTQNATGSSVILGGLPSVSGTNWWGQWEP
jgi:hypothetical protein